MGRRTWQPDPLLEQAERLLGTAQIQAVGMFTPLSERFRILCEADVEHFNFILTVAGVFMAATRLNNLRLGDAREDRLMEVVAEQMNEWEPDGISAFEDCKRLFESTFERLTKAGHEPRFVASDAVGTWIVWNVLGRAPHTDEEWLLARAAGGMVTHAFFGWWDE
ncbi:MAG: hypothetical protein ABFE13_05420 [Phycisphaerales bacterium]